jgi:hypothetical protein
VARSPQPEDAQSGGRSGWAQHLIPLARMDQQLAWPDYHRRKTRLCMKSRRSNLPAIAAAKAGFSGRDGVRRDLPQHPELPISRAPKRRVGPGVRACPCGARRREFCGAGSHELKAKSSLSLFLCHPKAEAARLVVIDELDSGLFERRLNFEQS